MSSASSFVLFTTADFSVGPSKALLKMLRHLDASYVADQSTPIHLVLLLQNCQSSDARGLLPEYGFELSALCINECMSLSAARNMMLDFAKTQSLLNEETIVGFPDDDSWYPDGILGHVRTVFSHDRVDLMFCRYGQAARSIPSLASPLSLAEPSSFDVAAFASSNTTFVRGRVAIRLGHFDPELGVGAPHKGGEDTDYALRAFCEARHSVFYDEMLVGHRDARPDIAPKYYRGSLIAIARYARRKPLQGVSLLTRKILVGVYFLLRRRLAFREFVTAFRSAVCFV